MYNKPTLTAAVQLSGEHGKKIQMNYCMVHIMEDGSTIPTIFSQDEFTELMAFVLDYREKVGYRPPPTFVCVACKRTLPEFGLAAGEDEQVCIDCTH